ncbi:MAG: tetratricopeptide repeat protein [Nitrospirae bacterium YQR-1]
MSFDFINYDDPVYITNNPLVLNGFTLKSFIPAFKATTNGNWSPLVEISNMSAVSVFGLKAYGHHLINVALHVAASIVLFYVMRALFHSDGISLFTALAFATHPMHVEPVAWISQRKDVLYAFFFFLSMLLYVDYAKRPSALKYTFTLIAFICSLMSKAMAVTLPAVLLIADIYPLERFSGRERNRSIIYEKIPFFFFSIVISVVTYLVQKSAGAVETKQPVALIIRLGNAVISLAEYVSKLFIPVNMSVFYPYRAGIAVWEVLVCAALITAMTFLAVKYLKKRPYIFTGWFFYLVTISPVIGIIQAGSQSVADRYTYVPYVGLFIIIACLVTESLQKYAKYCVTAAAAITIFVFMLISFKQISRWKDSETLLRHGISVTENNYVLYNNLAEVLQRQWKTSEALKNYSAALSIKPDYADARAGIGIAYMYEGNFDKALENLNIALQLNPKCVEAYIALAAIITARGQQATALQYLNRGLSIAPNSALLRYNLGVTYLAAGKSAEALENLKISVNLNPYDAKAFFYLGNVYAAQGKLTEAESAYRSALHLQPDYTDAMVNLGNVSIYQKRIEEAVKIFTIASESAMAPPEAFNGLGSALIMSGQPQRAIKPLQRAIELRPDFKEALVNLEIAKANLR